MNLESWKKFSKKISFEPAKNDINIDKIDKGIASYDDLVDVFARELTADEINLISGASKGGIPIGGTNYCPGTAYV